MSHDARDAAGDDVLDLQPVPRGGPVRIGDADAEPPAGLPDKPALREELDRLRRRLEQLQGALYADGTQALLVVLQGRDAGGKDGVIRKVFSGVNPQGVTVTSFKQPSALELAHDYLWRVHRAVPAYGRIGIFNRSHYEDVLVVRVHSLVPEAVWGRRFDQINDFERMLAENRVRILKFFLHISRDEQRERLLARLDDPEKNWKFDPGDLDERARWDDYRVAYEDALARCSTAWAPWYVVPANKKSVRNVLVMRRVVQALEEMAPKFPEAIEHLGQFRKRLAAPERS